MATVLRRKVPIRYERISQLLQHASTVSARLEEQRRAKEAAKPKRQLRSLTAFELKLVELAPGFLTRGFYNCKEMARFISKQEEEQNLGEIGKLATRIASRIQYLVETGRLPRSKRYTPKPAEKLRKVDPEEFEKTRRIIRTILNSGHPYLRRDWRSNLSWGQAVSAGEYGLVQGHETWNPKKGNLRSHLKAWVASTVSKAVRHAERGKVPLALERRRDGEEKSFEEKFGTPAPSEEAIVESDLKYLLNNTTHENALIYVLRKMGHDFPSISFALNLNRRTVNYRYLAMLKRLNGADPSLGGGSFSSSVHFRGSRL